MDDIKALVESLQRQPHVPPCLRIYRVEEPCCCWLGTALEFIAAHTAAPPPAPGPIRIGQGSVEAFEEAAAPPLVCQVVETGEYFRRWSCGVSVSGGLVPVPEVCPLHGRAAPPLCECDFGYTGHHEPSCAAPPDEGRVHWPNDYTKPAKKR